MTTVAYTAIDRLRDVLRDMGEQTRADRGDAFRVRGICHDGDAPDTVSVRRVGGKVAIHCHKCGGDDEFLTVIGWTVADLYDEPLKGRQDRAAMPPRPRPAPAPPKPAKGRVKAKRPLRGEVAAYPYCDENGALLYEVVRIELPGQDKEFRQLNADGYFGVEGVRRVLYRLPEVLATAQAGGTILVVEGEKDADNLARIGTCATTAAGGAKAEWLPEYTQALKGASDVVVVADNDEPGKERALRVTAALVSAGIPARAVLPAVDAPKADVTDHLAAGYGFDDLTPLMATVGRYPHFGDEPLDRLPESFWNATSQLRQIRQMAHARRAAPDAVLHASLTRLGALAAPSVRVDSEIKRPATIGWYCGLYGPSGAGKGTAEDCAEELMPFPGFVADDLAVVDPSTGQGIIDAYLAFETDPDDEDGKRKIKVQKKTRGYITATEGAILNEMAQMKAGGTLNAVLCKAWMSERQGTSNATTELKRELHKGAYVASMSLGVQEEPAARLLEAGNIGLPQRLAWAHATLGPDTPMQRPPTTGEVTVTGPDGRDVPVTHWVASLRGLDIKIPPQAVEEVDGLTLDIARGRGAEYPLDTHEPLWLLKAAALLALLHGYTKVTDEQWELAKVMWQVSRRVRDGVQEAAERRREAKAAALRAEAVRTAVEAQTATFEALNGVHPLVVSVAKRVGRWLANRPGEHEMRKVRDGAKPSSAENRRYRESGAENSLWSAALGYAVDERWVVALNDGATLAAGAVAPPA